LREISSGCRRRRLAAAAFIFDISIADYAAIFAVTPRHATPPAFIFQPPPFSSLIAAEAYAFRMMLPFSLSLRQRQMPFHFR
jgi:hypothetical protein